MSRLSPGLAALVLAAISCTDQPLTNPASPTILLSIDGDPSGLAYGPAVFLRSTGKPIAIRAPVSSDGFVGPFRLVLENDGSAGLRVTSAVVKLDGNTIFDPTAFKHDGPDILATTVLLTGNSLLEVELRGKPGSGFRLRIEAGNQVLVGPEGGTVTVGDAGIELSLPSGAVTEEIVLTAEPATEPPPPGATGLPGTHIEMGPSGTVFAEPIELSIPYDPAAIPVGAREEDLRLFIREDGVWVKLPGSGVDPVSKKVTGLTSHFSEFAVLSVAQFCPGVPTAFGTLDAAIAATIPGGTVEVCTGSHVVNGAVIDRPLTLRPVDGASPIIENNDPSSLAGIWINGYSLGTVLVRDMTFRNAASGTATVYSIRAGNPPGPDGTYDQIIIRNSSFVQSLALANVNSGGVLFRTSSVAGARSTVEGSSFIANTGVVAVGEVVNITGSSFQSGRQGVDYEQGAIGRVENSAFGPCGAFRCVTVLSSAQAEIASNTFTIEPLTGAPTDLQNVIRVDAPSSALITDNDFVGCARVRCVLIFGAAGGTLLNNRFVFDPAQKANADPLHAAILFSNNSTGTAAGNQFTNCWRDCFLIVSGANVVIANNTMTITAGNTADDGIEVAAGASPQPRATVAVLNNTIIAEGAISDPLNVATYPLNTGLELLNTDVTAFSGNTIIGAGYGIVSVSGSVVHDGRDNVFQSIHTGVATFGVRGPGTGRVTISFSDFTQYVSALQGHAGELSLLQCNYWGTTTGPSPAPAGIPSSVYTPWAVVPIAGTGATGC